MNENDSNKLQVLVTGDVTIDWHIVRFRTDEQNTSRIEEEQVPVFSRLGGAGLLGELIEKINQENSLCKVSYPQWSKEVKFSPGDEKYNHVYNIWSEINELNKFEKYWRINQFLGVQPAKIIDDTVINTSDEVKPTLLIIDDKGHGFRNNEQLWHKSITNQMPEYVIIRRGIPFDKEDPLRSKIFGDHNSTTINIVTAEDVRFSGGLISKQLSWEQTVKDLYREIKNNPVFIDLKRSTYTIVCFTPNACFLLFNSKTFGSEDKCWIIFHPLKPEEILSVNKKEWVPGFAFCIVAGISSFLLSYLQSNEINASESDQESVAIEKTILSGIKKGLACSTILRNGYQKDEENRLNFPFDGVCSAFNDSSPSSWIEIPLPTNAPDNWTIIEETFGSDLKTVAKEIATKGVSVIENEIPICKFGNLTLIDSREIEGFKSIQRVLAEYTSQEQNRPLSIGVFGPPGSGKSFGITEVAKNSGVGEIKFLTFNLSQFSSPDKLLGAFHQIRDIVLHNKLPVVFWDEFDCSLNGKKLGWLSYFLAPMQDGSFQEGQLTHPIGKSIFVFAGGTCETMKDLEKKIDDHSCEDSKIPDFLSRLKGYINILGINHNFIEEGENDKLYNIRRSVLLHAILSKYYKNGIDIDDGVLNALLFVPKYKYGARSLEAIISMSLLVGSKRFGPSSLPPKSQLELHVNASEFLGLLNET